MKSRRARRLVTVLAGAALLSLGATGAANADPDLPYLPCPDGYVCFFSGPNFTGDMAVHKNPENHDCGATGVRPARSIINRDDQTWDFFHDGGCRAWAGTLAPGQNFTDTHANSWS
jgi:hypothetical protein